MTVQEMLVELLKRARKDEALKARLLATKESAEPLTAFCQICNEEGFDIGIMDIVSAGEEDYDLMRRSINGGGGNHLMLPGEDDPYEMFIVELRM